MNEMEITPTKKMNTNILFHVSLLYNLVLNKVTSRTWWNTIQEHLILGALPLKHKHHFEQLIQEEKIQAIVTMNEPLELLPNYFSTPITPIDWQNANIDQYFGSTADFTPPTILTIQHCVEFIHEHIQKNETTFVHCKAGRGRSTVVVIAYLMTYHHMNLNEAYEFVKSKRSHISLTTKQFEMLNIFQDQLHQRE